MKKILFVFGTRPEAIKMAPLVKKMQAGVRFQVKVCVTAQHREMLDQVIKIFDIIPDYDLDVMAPNQDLFDVTSKVLLGLRPVLKDFMPDIVLVHGDTTTSMVAALAAFYMHIKVGHVEAGLRTYNLQSPWPEEMNRQLTDRITDFYFAPTEGSKNNLLKEGVAESAIFVTGNTVIDALQMGVEMIESNSKLKNEIQEAVLSAGYQQTEREYILLTGHRRENFGSGFLNICEAIKAIALKYPTMDIVYPVHLNPNVQKTVYELLSSIANVFLIKPLDYLPFVHLMKECKLILTDSGGVQEEAPSLGIPVLVMRDTTERPEAVEAGTVKLIGTDAKDIIHNVDLLLTDSVLFKRMSEAHNPYGDGTACNKIINCLLEC